VKAYLHRLAEVGGGGAGFLLPVFLEYRGANHELVQRIDNSNNVSDFDPFLFNGEMLKVGASSVSAEIGGPAIWAFRDTAGRIHTGTQSEVGKVGRKMLEASAFEEDPIAGAEMAAFIDDEVSFPGVLRSAYAELAELSPRGADVWRDTVVLLPRVKEDLASFVRRGRGARTLNEVIAISRARTTHIFASSAIFETVKTLPRWRAAAKIFGIDSFEFHASRVALTAKSRELPSWIFFGIGGVARWVIKEPPFHGDLTNFAELPDAGGAIVAAPISRQLALDVSRAVRLMIAVVMSDASRASVVDHIANGLGSNGIVKHAINIRPIGFGTPRKSKLSPRDVANLLTGFDYVWIVANHRQRQGVNYRNLAVSHTASRFVRACALALISCLDDEIGRSLLKKTTGTRGFGLVGAVRFKNLSSQAEIIQRVLYTMLCEDAHLHTAKQIIILWPYAMPKEQRWQRVKLGLHQYDVEVVERSGKKSHYDVVGLAFDVRLSKRTDADFRDFCISLFSGYGWVPRHENDENVMLENEGEGIRIWPVQSTDALTLLIEHEAEFGGNSDVIVTNRTLSAAFRDRAIDRGWEILHYSELDTWLGQSFPSIAAEGFRVD
jgi:hypothetical protein